MAYEIKRDKMRNRVYFRAPKGIYPPGARSEGELYWYGVADCPRDLKGTLDALVERKASMDSAKAAYSAVVAEIPVEYKRRHGSLYGGTVSLDGESFDNFAPAFGSLRAAKWEQIAELVKRAAGGPGSLITGRVQDRDTLYRATLVDGRLVYREVTERGFGDDMRESYWFPLDLFAAVCGAEIKARGITPESAAQWLSQYRGCVDTELYEFAVSSLPCATAAPRLSA